MGEVIVIGAGIVGLATARALLERDPEARITLLEKGDRVAGGQTGRNSGVVHAGIYYPPGSLKARLCRAGLSETLAFCERNRVPVRQPGKLIVAADERELERLETLHARAVANGIPIERVDAAGIRELEPAVRGAAALLSPTTGIVSYRAVAQAMRDELVAAGVRIVFGARVVEIVETPTAVRVRTADGSWHPADRLIACAGLQADRVARLAGLGRGFRIVPFRGEYFEIVGRPRLVEHLVYPVPDPAMPFLGVHLSPTIDGRITAGPNAVLGLARERYRRGAVVPADAFDTLSFGGFWRMALRYRGAAWRELRDSAFRGAYLEACRRYAPSLRRGDLGRRFAGIRAQALDADGTLVEDFRFERTDRQLHVCNAPSPAATSAIPIGRLIAGELAADASAAGASAAEASGAPGAPDAPVATDAPDDQ